MNREVTGELTTVLEEAGLGSRSRPLSGGGVGSSVSSRSMSPDPVCTLVSSVDGVDEDGVL